MRKRLLSFVLAVLMIVSILPATALAADETVTRIAWVQKLVKTFDMTVEADNYPDNYYSDIDSSASYYKDLMIAVEFGVIDLEAGSAFEPDKPATREFAAHTLNFCLGFQLDEGVAYTYTDKDAVTYPEDVQVAVNRGWFQLSGGKFLPEQTVTSAEAASMLADAAKVRKGDTVQAGYDSKYVFTDGVVVVPSSVAAEIADDGSVIIPDTTVALKEGDTFVVFVEDFPRAFKAGSIANDGKQLTVTGEKVDINTILKSIDAQGVTESDLTDFQPAEDVNILYVASDDTETPDLMAAKKKKNIKNIHLSTELKGVQISCDLTKLVAEWRVTAKSIYNIDAYVKIKGDASTSCTVPFSFSVKDLPGSANLGTIPVAGLGSITVYADLSIDGSVTLNYTCGFEMGCSYTSSDGFRTIRMFSKKNFTITTDITLTAGVTIEAGISELPILSARCYAKAGAKCNCLAVTHSEPELPNLCLGIDAWLYAKIGYSASVSFLDWGKSWSDSLDIWNRTNSPVRSVTHYEDGKWVPSCTCDTTGQFGAYFTPISSQYLNIGGSGAVENVPVYKYELDDDGNATITGFSGAVSSLAIPQTIDGHTVVAIGNSVFQNNLSLRYVVIPETVTAIKNWTFAGCSNLKNVTFQNGLLSIGEHAFDKCVSLTDVSLPKSLTTLGSNAFAECTGLVHVYIPKGITNCDYSPFMKCSRLNAFTFEDGIDNIPSKIFGNCTGLKGITIPDTVKVINNNAFEKCVNLQSITFSNTLTKIGDWVFTDCAALTELIFPETLTEIGEMAFINCTGLTEVTLPKNLTTLKGEAFGRCLNLERVFIPKSITNCTTAYAWDGGGYYGPFNRDQKLTDVTFEEGIEYIPTNLFYGCTGLATVTLPDSVKVIRDRAFSDCTKLESITLSNSLTTIENWVFSGCKKLSAVTFPDTLTDLGEMAFFSCTSLTEVKLPENLVILRGQAFGRCTALEKVYIPKSLSTCTTAYAWDATDYYGPFNLCSALKTVEIEEGLVKLPDSTFYGCTGPLEVSLPGSLKTIGGGAFNRCTGMKEITIPNTVTEIGASAFANTGLESVKMSSCLAELGESAFSNSKLVSIQLPNTVTDIGNYAFRGCTELKEITLPNTRQNITAGMFEGCISLEKIVLPETVTAIQESAFKNCTSLNDIIWSKAPTVIESNAFRNCSALTEVAIPGTVKSIGDCAFLNCDALTTVTIPDSVTSIGKQAFYDCDALTTVKLGSGLKSIPESTFEHCDVLTNLSVPRCVTSIGNNAFKDCTKFTSVTIPRSVTSISASAFSYPAILTIYGVAGTYAETFAKENSIKFVDQQIKATAASLDKTELTINKGTAAQLNLSVTPENFTDPVTWKTTDDKVVTISDSGEVKAVGVGTATIKVVVGDISASCKVTVLQPVTGINLNKSSLTMDALGTFQMTASVYPDSANDKRITWSSSDPAIASVDENGLVTALKKGTATITAAAMDGSGVKSTCKVTVSNTAYVCTDPAQLESPHNYDNSCTDVWSYRLDGASSLNVTFDARTEMEDGFDYLYILDGSGKEVGKYTGKELAGKTVSVPGDTVQIRMASDDAGNVWGFKVTSVKAGSETCQHVWDNGKVTKEPTETETGIKTYTCTLCGETKTETIPKLTHEHSYKDVVTAPTCTEKGYTTHTCACGDSYVDTYVDALGHAWDNGKVTKEPTETETGVKTFTCTRCGETKTEVIPALSHEHSYKDVVTAPTCTAKGYTTHTCACGDSYVDTYVDALGHAWDNGKVTKPATETEDGVKTFTCTRCGETKTEVIPATGSVDVTEMFTDVSHSWADDGIQYCVTHQLMSGIGNDLFGPKLTTTRAQIVQILYNLEGEPKVSGTTPFTDLTQDWYQDAVLWAYQTGVVAGTSSTTFEPDLPVTREQIAVILMEYVTRVLKLERTWKPADLSIFPDAGSVSDWAKDAMADAVGLGLISGASNGGQTLLEPQGSATREQVATILMEFCKNVKK